MRIRIDEKNSAIYLRLNENDIEESEEIRDGVVLDYDAHGKVVGVELLGADVKIPSRQVRTLRDRELYTDLKNEAVRLHRPVSEIIAEAVKEWLEMKEDERLLPEIDAALQEYDKTGGRAWSEVEKEWGEAVSKRERAPIIADRKAPGTKNVRR